MDKEELQRILTERLRVQNWSLSGADTRFAFERMMEYFVQVRLSNVVSVFIGVRGVGYGGAIKIREKKWSYSQLDDRVVEEILRAYEIRYQAIVNWCHELRE